MADGHHDIQSSIWLNVHNVTPSSWPVYEAEIARQQWKNGQVELKLLSSMRVVVVHKPQAKKNL